MPSRCRRWSSVADLAGVLIAKIAILFQTPADDALQLRRFRRPAAGRQARAACRWPFRTARCRRKEVGAGINVLAARLLRRHVRDSSHERASLMSCRQPPSRPPRRHASPRSHLGQPEIENLGVSTRGDEDICRLDVAVDDARSRARRRARRRSRSPTPAVDRSRADRRRSMLQRRALQKLHDDEHAAVLLADIVDRADVWVVQRRCGPRLALKAAQRLGITRQLWRTTNLSATNRCSRASSAL